MKNLLNLFLILSITACSSSKVSTKEDPYLYTIKNSERTTTKVESSSKGKISSDNFEILKNYLNSIVNYNIDFDKKIVINFIDNDSRTYIKNFQVNWDIFYGNLKTDLITIEQCNHLWVINKKVKNKYYYHGNKINWIVDKDNLIRTSFFNYDGLNGGFIIIKPNGDFFLTVGEYQKSDLLKRYSEFK